MFASGAATMVPILIVAWLTRTRLPRWRQRLLDAGRLGKMAMGISAVLTGFLIRTGADRGIEATLVRASPAWLTAMTTRV
jgi:cytochrome c-type biogenesis protein